jgi:O-acetyl-ADP-ribose deacetylase
MLNFKFFIHKTLIVNNLKMQNRERIDVVKGDITKIVANAIVNAANSSLLGGGGVDGAIHRAGGSAILDDCRHIRARQGSCATGEAVITTAGKLSAQFVIHTVGPVWNGGNKDEAAKLARCYANSLQIAAENGVKTIAFPNISTGIYHFPKALACTIALETVVNALDDFPQIEKVIFVNFDEDNYQLYLKKLG